MHYEKNIELHLESSITKSARPLEYSLYHKNTDCIASVLTGVGITTPMHEWKSRLLGESDLPITKLRVVRNKSKAAYNARKFANHPLTERFFKSCTVRINLNTIKV